MEAVRRPPTLLLAVLLLAACTGDDPPPPPEPPPSVTEPGPMDTVPPAPTTTGEAEPGPEPVALAPMPPDALRECRRLRALRPACPELVPEAAYDPSSPVYAARSRRGIPHESLRGFELQWGAEHPREPELDRPPATVHLVVSEGWGVLLAAGGRIPIRDGLLEERRRRPLFLGFVRWAGKRGELVLTPPYPRGGIEANHVLLVWSEGGKGYGISLHGWEPFSEVPDVLRAIVESIP
ncbi:MAG TPA: hypothetical protein VD704_12125 [Gaiellaceae bacterium]|nr:hypothetical protein [Gaiellaceae bacterium]